MVIALAALLAPTIRIPDIDGRLRTVVGDSSHRATVLFFVMPDCPISQQYAPELARIERDYRRRGVAEYLVQVDRSTGKAAAKKFAADYHLPMPTLLDPRHTLVKRAGATTVPTAAVFDPKGTLLYRGRIDDRFPALGVQRPNPTHRDLRTALDQLLSGHPVQPRQTPVVGCVIPE